LFLCETLLPKGRTQTQGVC